jgi:hypothetical protein
VAKRTGLAAIAAASVLAPAAAQATPFEESSIGDFGEPLGSRFVLPAGTDLVTGVTESPIGPFSNTDYFSFADLVPGSPFSMVVTSVSGDAGTGFEILDDMGAPLAESVYVDLASETVTGVVPPSGEVVIHASAGQDLGFYEVTIDATHVPEPAMAVLTAVGVGTLSFLRRRFRGA